MTINRHNYEEYFLLYVDNELNAADRAAVDAFVVLNSDLAPELHKLQQAVLKNEDIDEYEGKQFLIKSVDEINIKNYETYFLLYVDDELPIEQRVIVERFVLQHPAMQNAFMLLQQTKLEKEVIAFEGKDILYRKEGRKVAPLYLRMAAAAVFTGVAALLYLAIPSGNLEPGVNSSVSVKQTIKKAPSVALIPPNPDTLVKEVIAVNNKNAKVYLAKNPAVKPANEKPTQEILLNKTDTRSNVVNVDNDGAPGNTETVLQKPLADNTGEAVTRLNARDLTVNQLKQEVADGGNDKIIKLALLKELDTSRDEEDNSILFGSAQLNKNKLRGLLKKASGLFEKKGNKNDTDKSVRVASFEIKGK